MSILAENQQLASNHKHILCYSTKHSTAPSGQRRPRLVIEECPLTFETQTNDVAKELIEKVLKVYIFSWDIEKYFFFHGYWEILRNISYFFFINFLSYFKKNRKMIGDLVYQNLKQIEAQVPNCRVKNRNTGQWNRMEMPEIDFYIYKKFHNKPDEIKWGNNHYFVSAAGKMSNCSIVNRLHTFHMR